MPGGRIAEGPGRLLGFEVTDIDVITLERAQGVGARRRAGRSKPVRTALHAASSAAT
jgi:hypothetical protein